MEPSTLAEEITAAAGAARGHFVYESGHHGDLWLDLDALHVNARRVSGFAALLGHRTTSCKADAICGPVTGGAFLAQAMAARSGLAFVFAERIVDPIGTARYEIPTSIKPRLRRKRVLVVDDVINAGSAIKATIAVLNKAGAKLCGVACLLHLGPHATDIARDARVPLVSLGSVERSLWNAEDCPLCRQGVAMGPAK